MPSLTATDSCWHSEHSAQFRNIFPIFEPISERSKSEHFNFGNRFFSTVAIDHDARQIGYFGYPSAIVFALNFDFHDLNPQSGRYSVLGGIDHHQYPLQPRYRSCGAEAIVIDDSGCVPRRIQGG